ncbi:hypothetical protein MOQ_007992, partial [Trypanosoma cruzi marinkellei]
MTGIPGLPFVLLLPGATTHTDGQQHRASTNRAHSRRHVIIIVSVVVQWCGADLHSEGHGEQQGRREVRQTHTEGTPHEERAAAGTHTHAAPPQHQHTDGGGRSKQERHTRLHHVYIRKERSVMSAPLREGTHTHKKKRCGAHSNKSKVTINRNNPRTPCELLVHEKHSQHSSQATCYLIFLCMLLQSSVSSPNAVINNEAGLPSQTGVVRAGAVPISRSHNSKRRAFQQRMWRS